MKTEVGDRIWRLKSKIEFEDWYRRWRNNWTSWCSAKKNFKVSKGAQVERDMIHIQFSVMNRCYESTLVPFMFTWLLCWLKKHQFSRVYRGSKFIHSDKSCAKIAQNHTYNLDEVFLKLPPSSNFGLEARILQIGWFYRPKWKKVEKSASKNKHPIKLRFLIWRLQSVNPEKKVIPENQGFGSCPLYYF